MQELKYAAGLGTVRRPMDRSAMIMNDKKQPARRLTGAWDGARRFTDASDMTRLQ